MKKKTKKKVKIEEVSDFSEIEDIDLDVKMKLRFKLPLYIISLAITVLCLLGTCYIFYDKFIDETLVVNTNNLLSINYRNGNKFDEEKLNLSFSITNSSDEDKSYYIYFKDINGDATYSLKGPDISIEDKPIIIGNIVDSLKIQAKSTKVYELTVAGKEFNGTISVDDELVKKNYFADLILTLNNISFEPKTPLGQATTDIEGLIKKDEESGTSYYFRGNVKNNWVKFADVYWRIVKINPDGSVKLVSDRFLREIGSYTAPNSSRYEFKYSNALEMLNKYYEEELTPYADYIAKSDFCNEFTLDADGNQYTVYNRIMVDKIITFECLNTVYRGNIGLLTLDEVIAAGAPIEGKNSNYYLYNAAYETGYYTMTSAKKGYYPFLIDKDGSVKSDSSGTLNRGIRPVINIAKNVVFTGIGTSDNPYVLSEEQ